MSVRLTYLCGQVRLVGMGIAFLEAFGRTVRQLRQERGMTQAELAARLSLGRTSITNLEKGQQSPATAADMTPTEAARDLLARARITEPPVPVEQLASAAGAVISYQPFEAEDISGLLYRAEGAAPVIGVNSNNPKVRQRFTIGHEL